MTIFYPFIVNIGVFLLGGGDALELLLVWETRGLWSVADCLRSWKTVMRDWGCKEKLTARMFRDYHLVDIRVRIHISKTKRTILPNRRYQYKSATEYLRLVFFKCQRRLWYSRDGWIVWLSVGIAMVAANQALTFTTNHRLIRRSNEAIRSW
jgi:hypothetical protein